MIEVTPTTALLIYMATFLFICLGAWTYTHWKGRKKGIVPPRHTLTACEYCAFNYLTETNKSITTCPQCGSYNKVFK